MNETVDEHMPEKLAGIVKTHSAIAVGTALVPISIVDIAATALGLLQLLLVEHEQEFQEWLFP